jgi:hypothetical protein
MHYRSNIGISTMKRVFLVAVIVVIIALPIWWLTQVKIETATLEVSNLSLNPNETTVTGSATLSFTLKSNDEVKPHSVKVVFNTTSPVTFYQNNASLLVGDNGFQYLPITLQSSQQSTYPLKVTGTLTGGASTSTYSIRIEFYDENSTRFDTETVSLKISQ